MAEQLDLPAPTGPSTTRWRVKRVELDLGIDSSPGTAVELDPLDSKISVLLIGDNGRKLRHTWEGQIATDMITALNKANLSGVGGSLPKRILLRLIADGVLVGNISGLPD